MSRRGGRAQLDQLVSAAREGKSKKLREAIKAGADVNGVERRERKSALIIACEAGHHEIATELITRHSADPNLADKYGSTPLHHAGFQGLADVTRALIRAGADVNAADRAGVTPMHEVASAGRLIVAKLLIRAQCDLNLRDQTGKTPLEVAEQFQKTEMIRLLSETMQGIHVRAESAVNLNLEAVAHPTQHHGRAKTSTNVLRRGNKSTRGSRSMRGSKSSSRIPPSRRTAPRTKSADMRRAPPSTAPTTQSNASSDKSDNSLGRGPRTSLRDANAAEMLDVKQQLRSVRAEAKSLRQLNNELSTQIANSSDNGQDLVRVIRELDEMKQDVIEQSDEYELRIVQKDEEIAKLKDRITELEIENAEIRTKHEKTKTHLQGRINNLLTKYTGISEEISTQELHSPETKEDGDAESQHDADLQLLEKNKEIARLQRENEKLQEKMQAMDEKHTRVVKQYEDRINGILGGYRGVREELGKLNESGSEVSSPRISRRMSSRSALKMEKDNEFREWLFETVGLPQYLTQFVQAGADRLDVVVGYSASDLKQLGVNKKPHRKVLVTKIKELRASGVAAAAPERESNEE